MITDPTAEYAHKTDDELLHLACDLDSLTPEGKLALSVVMAQRGINSPEALEKFREEVKQQIHAREIDIGNLNLFVPAGIGRRMRGKTNIGDGDEYDATLFLIVFWFPLLPLGTYRVRRNEFSKSYSVLDKKPLNWQQVFLVWGKAAMVVFALLLAFDLFIRLG